MVDYPIVRFVSDADQTTARLDLNDSAPWEVENDGFSYGAPALEAEPLTVGAPYSWRDVTMNLRLEADSDVASAAFTALSVEMLRRTNWLMYQHDATSDPTWIRTFATQPPALDFTDATLGKSMWRFEVSVKADPFISLPTVTIAEQTISNNPSVADGICVELPTIEGDAPTPLTVSIRDPLADMLILTFWCSTAIVESECTYDFATPITLPTASFTVPVGAPIGALQADTQALGGQYRRISAIQSTWHDYLIEPTGADIPVGSYRVLGRMKSSANGTIASQIGPSYTILGGLPNHAWQETVRINPNPQWTWQDLGSVYLPSGARPDDVNLLGSRKFGVRMRAISGAPDVDLGGFMLVPVAGEDTAVHDSRVLNANIGAALVDAGDTIHLDGDGKRMERSPNNLPLPHATATGGYPMVRPGYKNFLFLTSELDALGALSDDLNREFLVTMSYRPQILHPVRRTA